MRDPLKYFRVEARELLEQLQSGLLELEREGAKLERTQRLLRLAHTLKGAARVVKQPEIAQHAHHFEELLLPVRASERRLSEAEAAALLQEIDAIASHVVALTATEIAPAPAETSAVTSVPVALVGNAVDGAASAAPPSFPTPSLERVTPLLDGVAELGFQLGELRRAVPKLAEAQRLSAELGARLDPQRSSQLSGAALSALRSVANELQTRLVQLERELSISSERAGRELAHVRDGIEQLRLVAAGSMFGTLERATRDAAVSLGKQAIFEAPATDVRLEAEVLNAVQRALVQAVRNAVAHGIEPSAERSALGKPLPGRVTLEIERRGKKLYFSCKDDGRGVDVAAVRREAERVGKLSPGSAPERDDVLDLLLHGGISTTARATEVSGRGVGLDLIREALAGVGGTAILETDPGAGTRLTLAVPASLVALEGLCVEAGGELYVLPLAAVAQARRVHASELTYTAAGSSLAFDGHAVPFFPLSSLLQRTVKPEAPRATWSAVIVRAPAGLLALGVDRLLGSESLVARALPDSAAVEATVAGVTLHADGNPRLLLAPDALLEKGLRAPATATTDVPRKPAILVIDDSLTTRMLEQSILESAGYEVALATSAEQGLELARLRRYALFLVDVEMPGMDGFTFIEHVRADPSLASIPAVLVTSRASAEDLARGKAVGANGHIAKGEFDQLEFLAQIERLTR